MELAQKAAQLAAREAELAERLKNPAYVYICNKWPRNRDFVVSVGSRSDRCGLTP